VGVKVWGVFLLLLGLGLIAFYRPYAAWASGWYQ